MIITRKWLEKYLDLSTITNNQISVALNSLGFEVEEEIDCTKFNNNKLVLGYIESVEQIPDTNLKKTVTRIGAHKTAVILSTSTNIFANQYVIVALPGAKLFNGMELDNREMQGVVSEGMFCGYNEIAFLDSMLTETEQAEIIFVASRKKDLEKELGKPVHNLIGLDDYAFDVDLTLNRSDALAGFQLVKELANYFNLKINTTPSGIKFSKPTQKFNINVNKKIEDKVNTISYSLVHLNVKEFMLDTEDSVWLKISKVKSNDNKFEQLANMATLKIGQPFILLDADKISNDFEITTQTIGQKEIIVLKNDKKLANIIGMKTEAQFAVNDNTQRILVLMLNLDQIVMRAQLKNLNTSNIDLQRYAKPLNPNLYNQGLEALLLMLKRYDIIDFAENIDIVLQKQNYTNIYKTTLSRVSQILGTNFTENEIIGLFRTLDIKVTCKKDELTFEFDLNRTDVYGQFDLCEEIARLYGYDNFDEEPIEIKMFHKTNNFERKLKNKVSSYLVGNGFNNIKSYSLTEKASNKKWNLFNIKNIINVMSPLSIQRESYRTNLSKSMIDTIIFNANNGNKDLKLFEIADIFALNEFRQNNLCFGISSNILKEPLLKIDLKANYVYAQSMLIAILNLYKVNLSHITFVNSLNAIDEIHPYINIEVRYKNKLLGFVFKLNPAFEKANKIDSTFICEINLDYLLTIANKEHVTKELFKFQKSHRDISMEMSYETSYQEVIQDITKDIDYLIKYKVVDLYVTEAMRAKGLFSITVKFEFNSLEKQLTEKAISEQFESILQRVKNKGITIR